MVDSYFSIERDYQFPYFCQSCLAGKPQDYMSLDLRYCQSCYEFLLVEAEMDMGHHDVSWKPKKRVVEVPARPSVQGGIMSTLEDTKSTVDIIQPVTPSKQFGKRGPKHKVLPDELINQWAGEGMGSKAIASRLREKGAEVSYKTVQRLLSGERRLRKLKIP